MNERDEYFKEIADVMPHIVWTATAGGVVDYMNHAYFDFTGLSRSNWNPADWPTTVHPDDRSRVVARWREATAAGAPYATEMRVRHHDGMFRWTVDSANPVRDQSGQITAWYGVLTDIHDRKTAEEALVEREQRLQDFLDTAGDWLWETDADHRFTFMSENYLGSDIEHGTNIGRKRTDFAEFFSEEAKRAHLEDLAGHRPFRDVEYRRISANGALRYVRISGKPVFDSEGTFCGYRGSGSDITGMVRARAELVEQQAFLRTTLDYMAQGILVVDAAGFIKLANTQFTTLLDIPERLIADGTPFEDVVRYSAKRGVYGDGDVEEQIRTRLKRMHQGLAYRFEQDSPHGRRLEVLCAPRPEGGFVNTYTDITERKQIEVSLEAAREAAESANHAKSAFLAAMSHELRTPLNAIIGFADIIAGRQFGNDVERCVDYASDIGDSGRMLLQIINDILDISKIEAGAEIQISLRKVRIDEIISDVQRMINVNSNKRGVSVIDEVPDDFPFALCDRQKTRQIIANLLSNAVKFSRENTIVRVSGSFDDDSISVHVKDEGFGMSDEEAEKAFEPFYCADMTTSRRHDGAGLGLSIVKHFVELQNGHVSLDSQRGFGTTVTVCLPRWRGSE